MNRMKQTVRLTSATLIIITGGDNMTWSTKPGGEEQYLCTAAGNGSRQHILEIGFVRVYKKGCWQ